MRNELSRPCFYGWVLSCTVPAACTGPPCSEMAKSLASAGNFTDFSQTTAVSISAYRRSIEEPKSTTNHCCCPISAVILMTSELEANLENQHLVSVLCAHERGGGQGQGCREGEREVADHMTTLIWLWRGGGANSQIMPCFKCTYVMYNAPVGYSFSYLPVCCRNLSRYKKRIR